ncbi:YTH-domain-containing protein [Dendrothele bispora CBS 962.96]|uniref:YTH-domain-containing protein n=1 Tax=Dendrothele bispora (strain CBS 962.96) TaxID=1314807 RepID=A0A4S8MYH9_DENBC|nr:YTH-domain-containing protein [Dendrothele bispora CBS 962.96]
MSNQPIPNSPASPTSGVRRHHTITAASRTARNTARDAISEESHTQENWNEDEVVGDDWVGGVGAVGEKSGLHRQSSLPTKYHRAFGSGTKSGTMTPKTMNSLTAIAGHEGDEEEWEREIGGYSAHDEEGGQPSADPNVDPNASSNYAGHENVPSPPPAGSGVRRHVSLTYGAQGTRQKLATGLRRSGTLQAQMPAHSTMNASDAPPGAPNAGEEEEYEYGYSMDDPGSYEAYEQYGPTSPLGRSSPWGSNDWRAPGGAGFSGNGGNAGSAIDDVQRALSAMEIGGGNTAGTYGQSAHPPRFNPAHPPPQQVPGVRGKSGSNNGNGNIEFDGRKTPLGQPERTLGGRTSNPNLQYGYHQKNGSGSSAGGERIPNVPPIPSQYLQQNQQQQIQGQGSQQPRLGVATSFVNDEQPPTQNFAPVDVSSLITTKGYNPTQFDIRPQFARFFVIKSYTEDDVHKSLKYEIWSSTDPGNKRLDKAFKESSSRGPIYLFFSVNASGHFCGMAEMLTPVDYTRSSTVWASDKWKGVFKVRWIFVRDIPNANLRHIKLNNTQERKPVTNSRDTQELLPDAGQEMLRIFHTHPARTSLLQDFAFYELQSMQKIQAQSGASSPISNSGGTFNSPQLQSMTPAQQGQQGQQQQQGQQNLFPMQGGNPNALAYQMPQMSPLMQMQMMGMNMGGMGGMGGLGMGNSQFTMPQSQAMHQSVMRHSSPGPTQQGGNGGNQQGFNVGF